MPAAIPEHLKAALVQLLQAAAPGFAKLEFEAEPANFQLEQERAAP
jgi:hypothetical protein